MMSGEEKPRRAFTLRMKMLDHLLGDLEIGDHAVPQGSDGGDVAGGPAQHLLGLLADGENLFLAAHIRDRHHGRLRQHDAATFHIDQGVCRAEIDGHVG